MIVAAMNEQRRVKGRLKGLLTFRAELEGMSRMSVG